MPRTETDREDLLRDAVALKVRGELQLPGASATVVAGCRENGHWSIYFGEDPCYHFDSDGRLRRAYVDDRLYRTQGATLAELRRVRADDATNLLRRDLDSSELASFLNDAHQRLAHLRNALQTGAATLLRAIPEDADVSERLMQFLAKLLEAPPALAPPIRTRRR